MSIGLLAGGLAAGQTTTRANVATGGAQGNDSSFVVSIPAVSADGRYVVFESSSSNLVAGDSNGSWDVFVRDRLSGTTELVSVGIGGAPANQGSGSGTISADGRYVAFSSDASNLVAGDTNLGADIFVRDRTSGTTERVNVSSGEAQGNAGNSRPSISADGRYVVFESTDNAIFDAGDTNNVLDIYLRDRQNGTTERVSVATGGGQANVDCERPSISADGRFVAFQSYASSLVAGDANGVSDIFVRDRQSGTTELVSVATGGAQGSMGSFFPSISASGNFVAFRSIAPNLVAGDVNGSHDIFVRDRSSATTEIVSLSTGGTQASSGCDFPSISADGRYVAFESGASNLVASDTNGTCDVFVRDRDSATTSLVSIATGRTQGNAASGGDLYDRSASISGDGRYVAFVTSASNLVPSDTNGVFDVFVHDRDTTGFPSLCQPGGEGLITCPCSNPPSGSGRGCDNSSATGGASLSASGVAQLSADTLVFTTADERATALSVVTQGNVFLLNGVLSGQGVRCVGGSLKRLFVKTAAGGSITAPDGGDPTISMRSAAKGDVIQSGQSRWYFVYYRDPIVLGGCPAAATFNVTQARQATWGP